MNFKKSAIALAVAGLAAAPLAAQADPTVYGGMTVGIHNHSNSNGGAAGIFVGGADGSTHLGDQHNTRFGIRGSNDLGNGMTAGYQIELGLGTSSGGTGGSVNEGATPRTRLSNISLSGDFGSVTFGTQWGVLYSYLGYNNYRSNTYGGSNWYYSLGGTSGVEDEAYGLRVDDAITYTYGGGGYSADPFTFSVQATLEQDTATNDETLDSIAVAAAGTFGPVTINGAVYSESDSDAAGNEPSVTGVGVRWSATSDWSIGGLVMTTDADTAGVEDIETVIVSAHGNLGGGNIFRIQVGSSEQGNQTLDSFFAHFAHTLTGSGSTSVWAEYETAEFDVGGGETSVLAVGITQFF